jgi:hypothetical protein
MKTKIAAALALLCCMMVVASACHQHRVVQLTATPGPKDPPCIVQTKAACLGTANACLEDSECARLIACVTRHGDLCGPSTEGGMTKAQELLRCWAASCPACPQPGGGST